MADVIDDRIAERKIPVDAVQTGGEKSDQHEIGVSCAIAGPELDVPGARIGHPDKHRTVAGAVTDMAWRPRPGKEPLIGVHGGSYQAAQSRGMSQKAGDEGGAELAQTDRPTAFHRIASIERHRT